MLELENYKGHESTKIPLSPFTLIVGDNGVGKSAVLEALLLLSQVGVQTPRKLYQGESALKWLRRSGAASPMLIRTSGPLDPTLSGLLSWSLEVSAANQDVDAMQYRYSLAVPSETEPGFGRPSERAGALANLSLDEAGVSLPLKVRLPHQAVILKLVPERLAKPSSRETPIQTIGTDGYLLPTVLRDMKLNHDAAFALLLEAFLEVVPSVKGIGFPDVSIDVTTTRHISVEGQSVSIPETTTVIADGLTIQFLDTGPLPAHLASEGTLLALGILTVLYQEPCPRLVLIEDIDRALHPRAQAELVTGLRRVQTTHPEIQIIATAHSPYLADSFEPEEVVVLGRPGGGKVVARRLSEHPDKRLLKSLTTGEFLSASGKEWFGN